MTSSMNVFTEVTNLQLPPEDFLVLGSGIMGALGIRPIGDLDLLVTPEVFERLRNEGWKYELVTINDRQREKISKDKTEAFKDFWWKNSQLEIRLGTIEPQVIQGIRFLPLSVLREVKLAMGREKDLEDIVLIDNYLNAL